MTQKKFHFFSIKVNQKWFSFLSSQVYRQLSSNQSNKIRSNLEMSRLITLATHSTIFSHKKMKFHYINYNLLCTTTFVVMMLGTSISIASDLSSKIILTFEFRLLLRTTSRRRIKFHVSVLKMMLIGNFILILTSLRVKVHQNGFGTTRCALANVRDVYCFLKTLTLLSREVVDHTWGINVCNFESCVDILSSSTFKKPSK